jgi:hypothetical protein
MRLTQVSAFVALSLAGYALAAPLPQREVQAAAGELLGYVLDSPSLKIESSLTPCDGLLTAQCTHNCKGLYLNDFLSISKLTADLKRGARTRTGVVSLTDVFPSCRLDHFSDV